MKREWAVTASERLKALDEALLWGDWLWREDRSKHITMPTRGLGESFTTLMHDEPNARAVVALRNALPELIVVVKAAERVKSIALDGDHALKDERIFDNLYEALAALDAKLSVT